MKQTRILLSLLLAAVLVCTCFVPAAVAADAPLRYVVLGDSIGYGAGVLNPDEACYGRIVADTNGYDYQNHAVSGNKTEHFGAFRAGLETGFALKTFVLLAVFVTVFIGAMPFWMLLAATLILLMTMSFICALTPMLSPYDAVTIQIGVIIIVIVYMAFMAVFGGMP